MNTNTNKNVPSIILPIETARETFRLQAAARAQRTARSVARRTSDDCQPCLEYREEIRNERADIDELLYLQSCRDALERCIAAGSASMRYRDRDGVLRRVRFLRLSLARVRIGGLA